MKTFKILLLLISFTFLSCDSDDDGFYNSEYLTIPNLVTIETQSSYAVNDYLYINSLINRLQTEENQTTLLDLRKSTGNAPSFNFNYLLERKVGTDWVSVPVSSSIIDLTDGLLVFGSFNDAYAKFDEVTDAYRFRAGIKLENAGEYRLSFGYNSSNAGVDLRSNSTGNNIFLNIFSPISNLNNEGFYLFTVN